jgi:prepilin-type N-terminal cleavage/methylation domain-containing protein
MYDRRNESGFTLIELIIAVVILGIIIVPLTGAIIDGLNTTTEAQSRLSETRSPMFSSVFFADDAQSVDPGGIQVGGSSPACPSGGGQNVVSFTWVEQNAGQSPAQYRSSYIIQTVGPKKTLVRTFCKGGSTDSITIAPVLGPDLSQCSRPACFSQQFDGTGKPRVLTLTASTCDTSGNARCPNGQNMFTLSATRRAT